MLSKLIDRLEQRFPALGQWLGDRIDLELPAYAVSILTHGALIAVLGISTYAAHSERTPAFRTEVVTTNLADFATMESTELAEVDKPTTISPVAGSFSPNPMALISKVPIVKTELPQKLDVSNPALAKVASVMLPTASHMDRAVSIQGSGAEHVGGVDGAVDRIAVEILRRLEKGRTLVVWAFDASGSLLAEREHLTKYIDGVYTHVLRLDKDQRAETGGLLTAVVGFGKDRKILCEPTEDRQAIASAIAAVPLDTSGIESTFTTVLDIVRKFGRFKRENQPYKTMVVVVTDEIGDDEEALEPAIAAARSAKVPVFVLGSPALFGRVDGFMAYTDPKTKKHYPRLAVKQGPESAALEVIRLPFWYNGPQYDFMDSGFGPYALSRLAGATEGIYFITRMGSHAITFDPAGMREYRPDWVSREQYVAAVAKHPIRRAVMRAALITQQNLPGQPSLNFPAADGPEFKEALKRNQEIVARVEYTVNEALGASGAAAGEPTIANTARKRDHETSRRWQAHYDLIRGRLLAMKIRCAEYNHLCARLQKDPPKFTKPSSNSWRLVPDPQIHINPKAVEAGAEAQKLLRRVVKDHPGTPWALLAQRELKDPLGFHWEEATVPPSPKRGDGGNNKPKPRAGNMPKPPEPPKL